MSEYIDYHAVWLPGPAALVQALGNTGMDATTLETSTEHNSL